MSGRNRTKNRAKDDGIGKTGVLLTNAIRDCQKADTPTEGVLQQTTPMAYATQTKTSRRKSMSPKQFGLFETRPAKPSMQKALQNLARSGRAHKSCKPSTQNRSDSGSMSFMRFNSPLRSGGFSSAVRGFVARPSAGGPPGNRPGCNATFSSKNRGQ